MAAPEAIAETFCNLDFHDETFVGFRVSPPKQREEPSLSIVEVRLRQYSEKRIRSIRFSGCSNLRVAIDFDVLADNLPPNTSGVDADTNRNRIRALMEAQRKDLGINYGPNTTSPLARKLAAAENLVLFRVQLFGGVIEVIAQDYEVEMTDGG